jgi:membrane protein YdbS with pleckstrin-like domain
VGRSHVQLGGGALATKTFKSKIDRWILVVLILLLVVDFGLIVSIALHPENPAVTTGIILACIAAMGLIASLLARTHYTVDNNTLRIVSGPFRWTVLINQISSVSASKSPLSAPALSLDRLEIRYGKRRRIVVSPADRKGFLSAIGQQLE